MMGGGATRGGNGGGAALDQARTFEACSRKALSKRLRDQAMKHTSLPSASRAEIAPVSSGNQAIIPAPPLALQGELRVEG